MQRSTSCTTNLKPNFENQTALVFGQRSTKYGTIPEYLVETKIWGIGVWNYADICPRSFGPGPANPLGRMLESQQTAPGRACARGRHSPPLRRLS